MSECVLTHTLAHSLTHSLRFVRSFRFARSVTKKEQNVTPKLGLEPRTPRLEVWCAVHCATWSIVSPKALFLSVKIYIRFFSVKLYDHTVVKDVLVSSEILHVRWDYEFALSIAPHAQ